MFNARHWIDLTKHQVLAFSQFFDEISGTFGNQFSATFDTLGSIQWSHFGQYLSLASVNAKFKSQCLSFRNENNVDKIFTAQN